MLHLGILPEKNARERGKKKALFFEDEVYTFHRFDDMVGKLAHGLKKLGLEAGDVVALHLPNGPEFTVTMFAIWRIGAVVTPINPALTPEEICYQLQDSEAKIWIYDIQLRDRVYKVLEQLGETTPLCIVTGDKKSEGALLWTDVFADEGVPFIRLKSMEKEMKEIALIIYTSGTTGKPKGVMLSHKNIYYMTRSLVKAMELTDNDRALLILPLFHVNGIMVTLLSPFFVGGSTVICRKFHPGKFFSIVKRYKPTYFSAVPTIYGMLLDLPEGAEKDIDMSCLRFGICGAAPMPRDLFLRFEQRYPIKIIEGYGLSEGTVASTLNPVHGQRKIGSIGLPLPDQVVKIFNEQNQEVLPGEIGEIIISGKNLMHGYLNRPEATKEILKGGWLRSGDLGYKDEDGYIYIVDRKKDIIIRGGQNVYPAEIENILYQHPAVYEAAVIGVEDEKYGEEVKAFVSLKKEYQNQLDEKAIIQFCQKKLAYYKIPKTIEFLDELPKNSVGKITKALLRKKD